MEYLSMLPGPTNVPDRVMRAMLAPIINHRSDDFVELYTDVVEKTQQVFQTKNDIVALSASGTGAVEASVINIVKKGDKIIIPVNGEFSGRLAELIEAQGAHVIKLQTPPGENATFDKIKEAFDNNKDVKAFYVVHNETSTGTMVNYLDRISDLTSRNDAMYVVDSVSILGGVNLPVDKWNIDVCMTGAQKAIAAPPGISPISISAKAKKYMIANPPPTMYFNLARYFKYYEESKHTPFTPALPLLYAYREALSIMLEEGLEHVFKRHKICSDALYSGLSAIGLTPFAKKEDRSISIIALNYLDGLEDKIFRDTLAEKFRVLVAGGFGNLKGKVFRVGCMGEVNKYHVMRTISAISSTLAMMGYDADAQAGLKTAEEKLKAL
ncbi:MULTISPECIES: alanine--glyoxylate aminotransferase family protein [Nitrosarchaeum]|uniref:Serine--pyruvate transaminase n=1 Tax=Nitrosarchaeum koreense MY1 TaxID=1001994 RepID=F9CUD6_9ARCH|nr:MULTISPECIES: alanine--glyoxylate aminotransferase family protein [Nitrosarchaeum]EGP94570.1 Serine--pyruvate transaminase [Nitrosarchaeum koreense MY1]MCV0412500.1 alanine--glyoxylate aminotransferase family protein [Nitrosarchaeum sp.]QLH11692.1 aminotransferase class V-fold PLP-dependent enzyme [Nitrosarchaeum sp. AC2]HSA75950.1 alanine--glyoxylate aminotransferase family protein [Nitrosarchaeum sp.]